MTTPQTAANILPEHSTNETTFSRNQRIALLLIGIAAYGLGSLASDVLNVFADVGHGGSLLNDPAGMAGVAKAGVVVVLIGVAGTIAGRSIRPDVGLFAAAIALLAIRRIGGPTRDVYLAAPTSGTLWKLSIESMLLAGLLAIVFFVARRLVASGWVAEDDAADGVYVEPEPTGQRWLAMATQALVVFVLFSILCRSDERMQVTATLAIGSILAAICTVRFIPATPSIYFWIAPLALSVGGYVALALTKQPMLAIGEPTGTFAAIGRSLPLDFASAGVAGSLYGYWVGRTMIPDDMRLPVTPEESQASKRQNESQIDRIAART